MYVHAASIFNYRAYQADIQKYVEQVDGGVYHSFQDYLMGLINKFQQERPALPTDEMIADEGILPSHIVALWPLYAHEYCGPFRESKIRQDNPSNAMIGWWFLTSLTDYLTPCASPTGNWKVIMDALRLSGWSVKDCETLFKGRPTSELLKPKIGGVSPSPLKGADPYWLWLHPGSGRAGWLTFEDLKYFQRLLIAAEEKIMTFDLHRLPGIDSDNPVVIRDYTKYLQLGYKDTLQMVESGIQKKQGLFTSITI